MERRGRCGQELGDVVDFAYLVDNHVDGVRRDFLGKIGGGDGEDGKKV